MAKQKSVKKKPPHRPPQYEDRFCEMLVDHMSRGYSIEAFAGEIGFSRSTIYNWLDKYPKFKKAKEQGETKSQLHWEKLGMAGLTGKLKNFNATIWIFSMKNRFGWRDKQDIEQNSSGKMVHEYVVKRESDEK